MQFYPRIFSAQSWNFLLKKRRRPLASGIGEPSLKQNTEQNLWSTPESCRAFSTGDADWVRRRGMSAKVKDRMKGSSSVMSFPYLQTKDNILPFLLFKAVLLGMNEWMNEPISEWWCLQHICYSERKLQVRSTFDFFKQIVNRWNAKYLLYVFCNLQRWG